jgi:hypothetical protein
LAKVAPVLHAANPTPRAIKLFENRMRYLAARIDAIANPERPDFVDRLFRRWLPPSFFEQAPPPLDESKLVILGAVEAAGPDAQLPDDLLTGIEEDDVRTYNVLAGSVVAGRPKAGSVPFDHPTNNARSKPSP